MILGTADLARLMLKTHDGQRNSTTRPYSATHQKRFSDMMSLLLANYILSLLWFFNSVFKYRPLSHSEVPLDRLSPCSSIMPLRIITDVVY